MPEDENKALVRNYLDELINKRAYNAATKYFPAEFLFNGKMTNHSLFEKIFNDLFSAFLDFKVSIEDQIAGWDKVVTRVTFHGTHQNKLGELPPTNKKISILGIAIDRIENNKVVEMWHEFNSLEIYHQLGFDFKIIQSDES